MDRALPVALVETVGVALTWAAIVVPFLTDDLSVAAALIGATAAVAVGLVLAGYDRVRVGLWPVVVLVFAMLFCGGVVGTVADLLGAPPRPATVLGLFVGTALGAWLAYHDGAGQLLRRAERAFD
ncbi:MAG: hypothetical protein ABEJ89_08585 [Haloarculaceae archaeon]